VTKQKALSLLLLSFVLLLANLTSTSLAQNIPTPESIIGFEPGADFKLADWDMMSHYFHALDKASDRVTLFNVGKSTQGKDMILLAISSKENLANLNTIKNNLRLLADPRLISPEEAKRLVEGTPICVFVGCAQHSSEVASTQASMEMAYKMASSDSPEINRILNDVLFLLAPSLNPDGHQIVCDWYNEQLGTAYEGGRMPWVYHQYVGHDINRDWAINTQVECRCFSRLLYKEWFPQIVIDIHQMGRSGARMFLPPPCDPVNPNIDPILDHELSLLSAQMRLDLSSAGHKGIITSAMFDEWLLGYFTSVPCRHNMVSMLIEMASVNIASPIFLPYNDLRGSGGNRYTKRANFIEPWEGGWWRLRNIVDYETTAVHSALNLSSKNRELFLNNFYKVSAKQLEAGKKEPPFAFIVPRVQDDPATAWKMLEILKNGGVEVHEAKAVFVADNITYPAGTRVILMSQPYRAHAKDMLEKQTYPDLRSSPDSPPDRPYDVAGWTLPLIMGVKTVQVVNPFAAELSLLEEQPPGSLENLDPNCKYLFLDRNQNGSFIIVNRLISQGVKVRSVREETVVKGKKFNPGTFVVTCNNGPDEALVEQIKSLGVKAYGASSVHDMKLLEVESFKLGLYQPWTASMDEGWTRWVLEQFEFPYRTIHDAEIRAGGLKDRYDVILLPDLSSRSISKGRSYGSMPEKYIGGVGEEGIFALRDFVREGGVLIGLDSSCGFLIDTLELPVKVLTPDTKTKKRLFCPGSILRINIDNTHQLGYGFKPTAAIFFSSSPVFVKEKAKKDAAKKDKDQEAEFIGTYPKVNPLMSGWIENDDLLHGNGALVQAQFEKGRAVLIGFRCQFRAQPHGTFKVLFNAILSATQKLEKK